MIVAANTEVLKQAFWQFLKARDVHLAPSADFQALGRTDSQGNLMGVVAYNGFIGNVCFMHTAGDGNWVSRQLIYEAFHYPFVQAGVKYVFAAVAGNNHKALRFDRKMGFEEHSVFEDGWCDGVPLYILKMSRENCRWIKNAPERKAA